MPSRLLPHALRVLLLAAAAAVIVRLAWLSDDAYITLRCVENWCQGHGLVWNVGERVQAFTHPLWLFVLAAGRALAGEAFFITIWLGVGVTLAAVFLLLRQATTFGAAIVLGVTAIASRSFTEYATSGLENPATYLLLAALAWPGNALLPPERRFGRFALIAALATLNRLDLAVLCAPIMLASLPGVPLRTIVGRGLLATAPLWLWLAFATFYYGSPFPITAYGKAFALGIPTTALVEQGLHHLVYVLTRDPVTLVTIALGIGVGLAHRGSRALALGALLYCLYVVKVGGDFMGGRFYTPPFVVALAILARWWNTAGVRLLAACGAGVLVLLLSPGLPCWCRAPAADAPSDDHHHGIIDERLFYYETQGLFGSKRSIPQPNALTAGLRGQRQRPMVIPYGKVGRYGFETGELVHLVDSWLLDPLLMRLPVHDPAHWRIGHFVRRIPEGYLETLATGENRIHHPGLRRVYDRLRTVIRGDLWSTDRLRALAELLLGHGNDDLRAFVAEQYRAPPRRRVAAANLAAEPAPGTWWFDDPTVHLVYDGGLAVEFGAPTPARGLRLSLAGERRYVLRFCAGDRELASAVVDRGAVSRFAGMQPVDLAVPAAAAGGFDRLHIDASIDSEQVAAVGGLALRP